VTKVTVSSFRTVGANARVRQVAIACLEKASVLTGNRIHRLPGSGINFDTVRRIGLALPGVQESTAYWARRIEDSRNALGVRA
jgi:hypothetical protein